ncbi:MAG TPA: response regulator [Bryobacteraceae bacterium]|jgi:two-component system response regulator RegA|nr:response regulator [Bryobacteraceae bacterium]
MLTERAALVVDDDDIFRNRLCRAFEARGWEAIGAADGTAALELASQSSPDLAIVDLRLPGMNGLDIVEKLRTLDETTCIIMLTGYGSIATALTATKLGADHYLSKPADADQILNAWSRINEGLTDSGGSQPAHAVPGVAHAVPSLARVEWEHIQRVLTDCDGNVSQAAKLLGLHRRSLQRKLAKYPPQV